MAPVRPRADSTLETALAQRRSVRGFLPEHSLNDEQLARLAWAAQGRTARDGGRTAPSAGALYPLELYVAMGRGLYRYDVARHRLELCDERDLRPALFEASLRQECVRDAAAVFVFAAVFGRTSRKYGAERSPRYVYMEAGHAAQNLLLEAVALALGGVPVGAFEDRDVARALGLPRNQRVVYLVPIGRT